MDLIFELVLVGQIKDNPSYEGFTIYGYGYGFFELAAGICFIAMAIIGIVFNVQNKLNEVKMAKNVADSLASMSLLVVMLFFMLLLASIRKPTTTLIIYIVGFIFGVATLALSVISFSLKKLSISKKCNMLNAATIFYFGSLFAVIALFVILSPSVMGILLLILELICGGLVLTFSTMVQKDFGGNKTNNILTQEFGRNDSIHLQDTPRFTTNNDGNNVNTFETDIAKKLSDLKKLKEQGIISQEQYEAKQKELLDKFN